MKNAKYILGTIFIIGILYVFHISIQQKQQTTETEMVTILQELKGTQKLQTAEMQFTKIIQGNQPITDNNGIIQSHKNIVLKLEGTVTAGIDINKINDSHITVYPDRSIAISLPPAEIIAANLTDETQLQVIERGTRLPNNVENIMTMKNDVHRMVIDDAVQSGLLKQAHDNAYYIIVGLLESSGVTVRHTNTL